MKQAILESLENRKSEIPSRSQLRYLIDLDFNDHINDIISIVYLYTRPKRNTTIPHIFLTEVICAIGRKMMQSLKMKQNSSIAAKTGAYVIYSFEETKLLQVVLGPSIRKHAAYVINVLKDEEICKLWTTVPSSTIEKLPNLKPYAPWESFKHETGVSLVKTLSEDIKKKINIKDQPLMFEAVNRAQEVGWQINHEVYSIHLWAFKYKALAFSDIWNAHSAEARATKMRETKAITSIATRFLYDTFYHLYTYDFRGRKYCSTAYLNEQGSDLAKGLLIRADKKPIGEKGFYWLCVSIASNWAGDAGREDGAKTDKIPLDDRAEWTLNNEDIIMSYAQDPKENQGWMEADKPWQFLAACLEFKNLRDWQTMIEDPDDYSYVSGLEAYIDGTTNGSQHLSALTLDEITAPLVNLLPSDLPGDLYMYVAGHLWDHLGKEVAKMTPKALKSANRVIDSLIGLKMQISLTEPKSDERKELVDQLKEFKAQYKSVIRAAAPVFWLRVKDAKHQRKVVKRGVMTLPYGAKPYGLGEQVITDSRKHGIDLLNYMEHIWGAYAGRELFKICEDCLQRPMRLLSTFEEAGRKKEAKGEFLKWTVPVTNFPVEQYYVEGVVKKTWVPYGPPSGKVLNTGYDKNTLQLKVAYIEHLQPSKYKQSQGAAPNIIHSLDAAHLVMTVCAADYPVTTIHDSFGCLLADMPDLYITVRETFARLYAHDPLTSILQNINMSTADIKRGNLNIIKVIDSEYCFS